VGLYGLQCGGFLPPVTPGASDVQPASFVGDTRTNAKGEIEATFLGTPTAFPGQTGALVPRPACRLVRVFD